jgi:hypothetical protein
MAPALAMKTPPPQREVYPYLLRGVASRAAKPVMRRMPMTTDNRDFFHQDQDPFRGNPRSIIKKPAEGAAGKDHFKKWRERKTEIDYRSAPSRPLRLLQLLTKLGNP